MSMMKEALRIEGTQTNIGRTVAGIACAQVDGCTDSNSG